MDSWIPDYSNVTRLPEILIHKNYSNPFPVRSRLKVLDSAQAFGVASMRDARALQNC